jgi:hypothetical protein
MKKVRIHKVLKVGTCLTQQEVNIYAGGYGILGRSTYCKDTTFDGRERCCLKEGHKGAHAEIMSGDYKITFMWD